MKFHALAYVGSDTGDSSKTSASGRAMRPPSMLIDGEKGGDSICAQNLSRSAPQACNTCFAPEKIASTHLVDDAL